MNRIQLLTALGTIAMSTALGGCASVSGFPEPIMSPAASIKEVEFYLSPAAELACRENAVTRTCRNNILDARIRAGNVRFGQFERNLYSQGIGFGVGTDWLAIALNSVATFSKSAAPELSAVSAAVIGGRASFEKQALYNLSLPVMLAQIYAKRQEVLARIRAGETREISEYSLYRGLDDVDDYEHAGSIPAAMTEIVTNAGAQASEAKAKLDKIDSQIRYACTASDELSTATLSLGNFNRKIFRGALTPPPGTDVAVARTDLQKLAALYGIATNATNEVLSAGIVGAFASGFCTVGEVDAFKMRVKAVFPQANL